MARGACLLHWFKRRAALGTDAKSVGPALSQRERENPRDSIRDLCAPVRWLRAPGGDGDWRNVDGRRRPRADCGEGTGEGPGAGPAARAAPVGPGGDGG